MLERVSPQAECAAHIFVRRFETPVRSYRSLGHDFWKYGADTSGRSSWWPSYLDSIRVKSHAPYSRSSSKRKIVSSSSVAPRLQALETNKPRVRAFTDSSRQDQVAPAQVASEANDETSSVEVDEPMSHVSNFVAKSTVGDMGADKPERLAYWQRKALWKAQNAKEKMNDLERTWKEFVSAGYSSDRASSMVQMFARGNRKIDFDRVLCAFDYVPQDQRSTKDYRSVVDASIRLNRYSTAITFIDEAVSRDLGHDALCKFLAFCTSRDLWNTAGDVWKLVCQYQDPCLRHTTQHADSKKQNFAGECIAHFETLQDFPSKVVGLATRLAEKDPSLSARWPILADLCKHLALVAVESEKVMGIVNAGGMLALLGIQRQLGFDVKLHFAALATLSRMTDVGTRSRLAILIYRNFKLNTPSSVTPKWVFGTMIGICSAAKQDSGFYRSLLADCSATYKTPDRGIYLRILRACASHAEVDDVYAIFHEFHQSHKLESADDLNPLIRVHAVTGDYQQAQRQFNRVQTEFKLSPNVRNWNALILAYSRSGNEQIAFQKFDEMDKSGIKADQFTWSMIVALASKKGDTRHALALLNQARAAGISPPLPMVGAIVDSHLLNGRSEDAWSLVVDTTVALRRSNKLHESPVRLWNSLFRYYAFEADSKAILRTQEKMKTLNVMADGMTYAALMTALIVQGRTQDASHILRTLHFSQSLSATEFHYSILVHGFAMEKKREQAQTIYNEMLERFPRPTMSAKLAMLYLQATRDEEVSRTKYLAGGANLKPDFQSTLNTIKNTLTDVNPSDLASSFPSPGFGRRSLRTDMDQVFFGSLIKFLHRNHAQGASDKVLKLLKGNRGPLQVSDSGKRPSWISSIEASIQEMEVAVNIQDWEKATLAWRKVVDIALDHCTSGKADQKLTRGRPAKAADVRNIELLGGTESGFFSVLPHHQPLLREIPNEATMTVMPAHQYVLSRPLSQLIKALDKQRKHSEMIETIQMLRGLGFNLSSKNWNALIQVLCKSPDHNHQMLAYALFEHFLLPNAPSWQLIRRGKWIEPSEERPRTKWEKLSKVRDDRKSRRTLEKLRPGLLMPSYYTMISLAIVWQRVTRALHQGDRTQRQHLENRAPGTVGLVLQTPYLKDRVQGVLLRGLQVIGDKSRRPRQSPGSVDRAGVQGSQLLIDHISPDTSTRLRKVAKVEGGPADDEKLSIAEELLGEVAASQNVAPSKGRFETHSERRQRILRDQQRRTRLVDRLISQVRADSLRSPSSVGTVVRGQPAIKAPSTLSRTAKPTTSTEQKLSQTYRKIAVILRTTGRQPLHESTALSAGKQKTLVRTASLTQRRFVRLILPVSDGSRMIAQPHRRPRKSYSSLGARSIRHRARISRRAMNTTVPGTSAHRARLRGLKYLQALASSYRQRHDALILSLSNQATKSRRSMAELKRRKILAERATTRAFRASREFALLNLLEGV